MILFESEGDIFQSNLQTLVCPVNVEGTMGAGLALHFSLRFPGLLIAYKQACREQVFKREKYFVWHQPDTLGKKVLCLPTKRLWRNPSLLPLIDEGLEAISENYWKHEITSMAIPGLGTGLGRLEWDNVRPLIWQHFEYSPLQVGVFLPYGTTAAQEAKKETA